MAGQINASAKQAYDALAAEYRQVYADITASTSPRAARERAHQHLMIARRIFRIAAFQAPAEGEINPNFDASIGSIRRHIDAARNEITASNPTG